MNANINFASEEQGHEFFPYSSARRRKSKWAVAPSYSGLYLCANTDRADLYNDIC